MGITDNPVRGFRRPKLPLPRDVRLMAGDDERLIEKALDFNREIAPAIILAIETAMRQGEIAKLRWEHIDLEAPHRPSSHDKEWNSPKGPVIQSSYRGADVVPTTSQGPSLQADSVRHEVRFLPCPR